MGSDSAQGIFRSSAIKYEYILRCIGRRTAAAETRESCRHRRFIRKGDVGRRCEKREIISGLNGDVHDGPQFRDQSNAVENHARPISPLVVMDTQY